MVYMQGSSSWVDGLAPAGLSVLFPFLGRSIGEDDFWLWWTSTYSESVEQSTVKAERTFSLASEIDKERLKTKTLST